MKGDCAVDRNTYQGEAETFVKIEILQFLGIIHLLIRLFKYSEIIERITDKNARNSLQKTG
jgi:hypothetical protein